MQHIKNCFFISIILFCSNFAGYAKTINFEAPTADVMKLHSLINQYRLSKGLPEIPLSKSLTHVAMIHAKDIQDNPANGSCNGHSWSSKGPWTSCCYTPDHAKAKCMWDKPRELTNYAGNGYECAYAGVGDPEAALRGWQGSSAHNAVIINQGIWARIKWKSIGVGISGNNAVIWFGEETDPDGYYNSADTDSSKPSETRSDKNEKMNITFKDGTTYTGQLKDGKPNGRGTCTWTNGNIYSGQWIDNKMEGQGKLTTLNGVRYEGEFKNNGFNGYGTLYKSDGTISKQGQFKNGNFIGK